MIHAVFNQSTGFKDTYQAIMVKICEALRKYGVVVLMAWFVENKYQVNLVVSNFYDRVTDKMNLTSRIFDLA